MLIEDTYDQIRRVSKNFNMLNVEYSDFLISLQKMLSENPIIEAIENENKLVGFKSCEKTFFINKVFKINKETAYFEIEIYEKTSFPIEVFDKVFSFCLFPDGLTDIENNKGQYLSSSYSPTALSIAEISIINSIKQKD